MFSPNGFIIHIFLRKIKILKKKKKINTFKENRIEKCILFSKKKKKQGDKKETS